MLSAMSDFLHENCVESRAQTEAPGCVFVCLTPELVFVARFFRASLPLVGLFFLFIGGAEPRNCRMQAFASAHP